MKEVPSDFKEFMQDVIILLEDIKQAIEEQSASKRKEENDKDLDK